MRMHEVTILSDNKACGTKIIIDGKEISAIGFDLSQSVGEVSTLDLEIPCFHIVNQVCLVNLKGIDDVARLMDEETLNKFMSLWQKYHAEDPICWF